MKSRNLIILAISISYALIVGSGVYGYGNDYYIAYYKHNLDWGKWFDRMGYIISTLSFFKINFGVYIVSFILSYSTSFLMNSFFSLKKMNSTYFFIFINIVIIHTWPIIMSTSNAMKQGLCMSLIFFSLSFILSNKIKLSFFFMLLSIFLHRVGIFFFLVFLITLMINYLDNYLIKLNRYFYFFLSIFLTLIIFIFLPNIYSMEEPSRIINGDFRVHFFLINLLFIIYFTFRHQFLLNKYILFLYLFSFLSNALLFLELNWQFERLCMMLLIPYILSIGFIFNRKSCYYLWNLLFCILFFATIGTGMYDNLT